MKGYVKIVLFLLISFIATIIIACGTPTHYGVSAHYGTSWSRYGYSHHHHRHYRPPPLRVKRHAPRAAPRRVRR